MSEFNITKIKEIQAQSLSSVICGQLEELILSGHIKPGERINESQLSSRLGVSRAPIREACRLLERYGMVEVKANRGTFVNKIDITQVTELYDIRASLDALAGEKAAEQADRADLRNLKNCLRQMQKAAEAETIQEYYKANIDFHMEIIYISANSNLISIIESVYKKASLFRKTSLSLPGRLSISHKQHRDIFNAIEAGNPAKASQLMKHHVLDAKSVLLVSLNK